MQETPVQFLGQEDPLEKGQVPTPVFLGFPGGTDGKESIYNAGDLDLIPGLGRSSGEGNGSPLQYSCLENPMDGGAWQATVHAVGCNPWGRKEWDTTERLSTAQSQTNTTIKTIM